MVAEPLPSHRRRVVGVVEDWLKLGVLKGEVGAAIEGRSEEPVPRQRTQADSNLTDVRKRVLGVGAETRSDEEFLGEATPAGLSAGSGRRRTNRRRARVSLGEERGR
jgi:hypothetical protein